MRGNGRDAPIPAIRARRARPRSPRSRARPQRGDRSLILEGFVDALLRDLRGRALRYTADADRGLRPRRFDAGFATVTSGTLAGWSDGRPIRSNRGFRLSPTIVPEALRAAAALATIGLGIRTAAAWGSDRRCGSGPLRGSAAGFAGGPSTRADKAECAGAAVLLGADALIAGGFSFGG
jgi:hypothetical protein